MNGLLPPYILIIFSKIIKSVSFSSVLILNVEKSSLVEVKACEKYDCFGSSTLDCHFGMGGLYGKAAISLQKRKISLEL